MGRTRKEPVEKPTVEQIVQAAERAGLDLVEYFKDFPPDEAGRQAEMTALGWTRILLDSGLTVNHIGQVATAFVSLTAKQRDVLAGICQQVAAGMRREGG